MWRMKWASVVVAVLLLGATGQAAYDVTGRDDVVVGVPNDGKWPSQEGPALAIDDRANTKYLHFQNYGLPEAGATGFRVTPKVGTTVVSGMTFTTANDCPARDPVEFELHGSNGSIDGPYTLITKGEIFDFKQLWPWPRQMKTTTPVLFSNSTAYRHYQVLFTAIRDPFDGCANSMQIAEVELLAITYKATSPEPAQGTVVMGPVPLRWTAGETAVLHNVYLGTTAELTEEHLIASLRPAFPAMCQMPGSLEPGTTYYWRVDQIDGDGKVCPGDVWSFIALPNTAYAPIPRDGDKWIDPNVTLTWLAGRTAVAHDLYFGMDRNAVATRDPNAFVGPLNAPIYQPGPLEPGITHYWVVDEVGDTKYRGDIWSFTTFGGGGIRAEYFANMTLSGQPFVTRIEGCVDHLWTEADAIVGGRRDDVSARWTADLEIAVKDVYTFITTSDDGVRLWLNGELLIDNWTDHGPMDDYSKALALAPGIYTLRMEWYEYWAGATAQLWWETAFAGRQILPAGPLQPPLRAVPLYPAHKEANIATNVALKWSPGERAVIHDVYFGQDADAVAKATPEDLDIYQCSLPLGLTTWTPGPLECSKTYYWRIDEVNPEDPASPWQGHVNRFTTAGSQTISGSQGTGMPSR